MKMCTEKEIRDFLEIYDCYGKTSKEIINIFLYDFFLDQPERLTPEDQLSGISG